jgi:hypothetical protein
MWQSKIHTRTKWENFYIFIFMLIDEIKKFLIEWQQAFHELQLLFSVYTLFQYQISSKLFF